MSEDLSGIDSVIRPFNRGVTRLGNNLATILLLESVTPSAKADEPLSDNLFLDYITALTPDPNMTKEELAGIREGGNIADLSDGNGYVGLDGTHKYYGVFNNFSLISVTEQSSSIVKVHQNFSGYWNAFFFGQSPKIYTFTGMFLDTQEHPYYQEFLTAYDRYLSGEKCVANNMKMKITYDGRIADGYILNISTNNSADQPYMKQFSFNVLVRGAAWIRTNELFGTEADGSTKYIGDGVNYMSNAGRMESNALWNSSGTSSVVVPNTDVRPA